MNEIEAFGRRSAVELAHNLIFPKVVDYLKEKFPGSDVAVKDLMGLFEEEGTVTNVSKPVTTSVTRPTPPRSTSKTSSVTKKNQQNLIYEKPEEGVRCIYKYQRGPKAYTYCGKPCEEGLNYCKYCKKKKKKKPGDNSKKAQKSKVSKDKKEEKILEVSKYYDLESYYIQTETNFIVREDDQTICVVAKELGEREIRPLTSEEKSEAEKYDLVFIADPDKEQEAISSLQKLLHLETEEKEVEETLEDMSPQPIPIDEEPLITKVAIPVIPTVPEVPAI